MVRSSVSTFMFVGLRSFALSRRFGNDLKVLWTALLRFSDKLAPL